MDLNPHISKRVLELLKRKSLKRVDLVDGISDNRFKADKFKLDNYLDRKAKWDINYIVRVCNFLEVPLEYVVSNYKDEFEYDRVAESHSTSYLKNQK